MSIFVYLNGKDMLVKTGSLRKYPFISYEDYKTSGFIFKNTNSTSLIWNTKSDLKCALNNQEIIVPSNTIILLDKSNSFSCQSNNLSQVKVLRLNTELFSSSITFVCGFINKATKNDLKDNTILFFRNENTTLIENCFVNVQQILEEEPLINVNKLKLEVCSLLHGVLQEKFEHDAKYINHFGELLNSQFRIFHNVSDYALQLNMEPKNLLRKFQKRGLKNPSNIIKEKLLFEIKRNLIYTDKSIRDICFETGFYDPAYFSRFFKKHVGVTAQYFRKQYGTGLCALEMENSTVQ